MSMPSSESVALATGVNLANVSTDEINNNRDLFKQALAFYSGNIKFYAKWFEINEINKNEDTFTSYKVVYRFLPKDLNESIKQVVVWKRFRDFKDLNLFMSNHHAALHRRDKFPEFTKSKFFGRFDDKVIEERRQCALRLLQFIGSQSHLYKQPKFIEFFSSEGATFSDYQTCETITGRVLQPDSSSTSSSSSPLSRPTTLLDPTMTTATTANSFIKRSDSAHVLHVNNTKELNELILDITTFIDASANSYDYVIDNLVKTRKLLSLSSAAAATAATTPTSSSTSTNSKTPPTTTTATTTTTQLTSGDKYLKSALTNLTEFMSEMEHQQPQTTKAVKDKNDPKTSFLKSVYKRLNALMDKSLALRQMSNNGGGPTTPAAASPVVVGSSSNSNLLNDWIVSDFNLVSYDFNSELSFISGNLFDLSFNYKIVGLVSENCFLMKLRHSNDSSTNIADNSTTSSNNNQFYLLKRLQKSFNPTSLTSKSLVPFKNRIPYMCQLIKYYESESTIFLLVDYHEYGALYPNMLRLIRDAIDSFPHNLAHLHKLSQQHHHFSSTAAATKNNAVRLLKSLTSSVNNESETLEENSSGGRVRRPRLRLSHSFSGAISTARSSSLASSSSTTTTPRSSQPPLSLQLPVDNLHQQQKVSDNSDSKDKRRAQSHSHSVKFTVVDMSKEKPTLSPSTSMSPQSDSAASISASTSSSSSSSSSSSTSSIYETAITATQQQQQQQKTHKHEQKQSSGEKVVEIANSSRVVFKATAMTLTSDEDKTNSVVKQAAELSPSTRKYQVQVRLWLAQLLCALRNLHEMGIVRKDLTSDDLLLTRNADLCVTYTSKWNLVDERVKRRARTEFYAAPELSGMVNNPITEACDWWSFGIIAYELMSTLKFADMHEKYELYVEKINFPSDFNDDLGRDLIKKLLRLNPAKRLTREQIQQHSYFTDTDWITLEESFWKAKS